MFSAPRTCKIVLVSTNGYSHKVTLGFTSARVLSIAPFLAEPPSVP